MKKTVILLILGAFLAVSCVKNEQETPVPNVISTPCQQSALKSNELPDKKVDVKFTGKGVQITYYNFEVTCDFTDVKVTHTFVNGFLNITQQGTPNQAKCVCYTDVSYTITGILQNEVNVIFINGEQVYCYNAKEDDDCIDLKIGEETEIKLGETACNSQYDLSLRVENVNDSRCPVNPLAICVWEGNASVQFHLTTKNGKYNFTLDTYQGAAFKNDTIIEGIKYQLINVLPYPVSGEEQPIKTVKILVEKYNQSNCDKDVIISKTEYENAPNEPFTIEDIKIESNCLKIKFNASGCKGNWKVELIDKGDVAYSIAAVYPPLPPTRTLRLSVDNFEVCPANFLIMPISREISFNIEDLQVQGNSVYLNISGKMILYKY